MGLCIDRVQFEHHREAIGIGESSPRISWRFSGDNVSNWTQRCYEIEVTRAGTSSPQVYSVESSESVLVPWPSQPLPSRASASIRVRATGCAPQDEQTPWSEAVLVETGLLDRSDWKCSLISSALSVDISLPRRPVLFRKTFSLDQRCRSARLYITAQGVYEAHINGQRAGDHVLAPGWTSYKHRLPYQTFDVTGHLDIGQNVVTAQVAEGWFCGRLGFLGGFRNIWGDQIGLIAMLVIELIDGSTCVIDSDAEWKSSFGSILTSEIYDGEVCDLSLETKHWQDASFDDATWAQVKIEHMPGADLVAPDGPPVRMIETLPAAAAFATPTGNIVVDFRQNLVGWVRIRLYGQKGQIVKLHFAEELENGEVATRPLRSCKASDTIMLSGEDQVWQPKFTFHGFRYVQLDGLYSQASEVDLGSIEAVVVHTDMEPTGWFKCSNPLLNQLHKNILWGMKGNFLSIPTDCPQRDERLGWTGDIHMFGPTANFFYDTSGMLRSWLKDLAAEQIKDHGSVPPFFCPNVFVNDTRHAAAIWGDVVVGLPWVLYMSYADSEILNDQLDSMQRWISDGIPYEQATGLWDENSYQFGDWLDPLAPPDDPGNSITDPQLVANAYLVHITSLMREICLTLGLNELAKFYSISSSRVKSAFQRRYLSPEGRVVSDSQTGIALSIHFQLFSNQDQQRTAAARLKHLILRNSKFKIATGFAGTPIIGHVLSQIGEPQLFYRMLYHRKVPSWLFQVSMGATTMWERWDSKLADGSINPGEMTSFNHYALGAVADWMHRNIAGLAPLTPGWRRFAVAPTPGGDLKHATAKFMSPYGLIYVEWVIDGTQFHLTVKVPPNTTAEVRLPDSSNHKHDVLVIGSGTYKFKAQYERPVWPPLPIYPQYHPHDDDEP